MASILLSSIIYIPHPPHPSSLFPVVHLQDTLEATRSLSSRVSTSRIELRNPGHLPEAIQRDKPPVVSPKECRVVSPKECRASCLSQSIPHLSYPSPSQIKPSSSQPPPPLSFPSSQHLPPLIGPNPAQEAVSPFLDQTAGV